MSSEAPKFIITPEIVEAVMEEADSYDETLEFAKLTMAKVREQHPPLYGYLAQTAKEQGEFWYSYSISSALSYSVMTRELQARGIVVEIAPDDVETHKGIADRVFNDPRWNNEAWVLERATTRDGVQADSGLGFFLNIVDAIVPEFGGYIADFTAQIEVPENRRHTLRGFYDGFMPFYTKVRRSLEVTPTKLEL